MDYIILTYNELADNGGLFECKVTGLRNGFFSFPRSQVVLGNAIGRKAVLFLILWRMRSRYRRVDSDGIYFRTATVAGSIPVFIGTDACGVLIDALDFCRKHKGLRLYACVIMEKHVHLVAEAAELSQVVQCFALLLASVKKRLDQKVSL